MSSFPRLPGGTETLQSKMGGENVDLWRAGDSF